ncbi:unnamed protein product, partial [Dracunculus medinensis]|uniref:E3 ubiquitin-protein ligase n=1 Tax=Dracunculus medinensis TaxID=318479 RepID=A0A0N4UG47_DRAME
LLDFSHLQACAPPVPPPFEPFFAPITELLRCNVLVFLIHIILQRTIKRSRFSSDGMLHRTLFLIGMGLNEQKICKDFDFVSRAENLKVFQLLEQLVDKPEAKQNAQLLDWVIHTYKKIKEDITGIDTMKETRQVSSNDANLIARKATAARMRKQALLQVTE